MTTQDAFGDPGWFANRIWPEHANQEKSYDIGVVLHFTEWTAKRPDAQVKPELKRYHLPQSLKQRVCFINPIAHRSVEGVGEVVRQIGRCRTILSTSLHGLVIAESLGIPSFFFGPGFTRGPCEITMTEPRVLDHRMRDLYSILGRETVPAVIWPRQRLMDWQVVLDWCEKQRSFYDFDEKPLFEAFPFHKAVSLSDQRWPLRDDFLADGNFL
nr:polysaccharide pyruvyl transferase family protein [Jiella sp. LLJ827]